MCGHRLITKEHISSMHLIRLHVMAKKRKCTDFKPGVLLLLEKYRIAGMFGGFNVWQITELKLIGEIKFGEWIDFGHKVLLPAKIWLVKVERITDDSPNSPNFPAAKHSYFAQSFSSSYHSGYFVASLPMHLIGMNILYGN